jgi:glycosyltransferase involved in cell wall biosynthesis
VDVTICICTYGDRETWVPLSKSAFESVRDISPFIIQIHRDSATLADVRNEALSIVQSEWVCFLDADDALAPDYFLQMQEAPETDLRGPAVQYVSPNGISQAPYVPWVETPNGPKQDGPSLVYGNWLVIGTLARTNLVKAVGGFREWPMYEDWDLWLRCWQHGCSVSTVPTAVYIANVRHGSRNRYPTQIEKHNAHRDIAQANGLPFQ